MAAPLSSRFLRLQRLAETIQPRAGSRFFSATSRQCREVAIPKFEPTDDPHLDKCFQDLRSLYIAPSYLSSRERKMIFSKTHANFLRDNPQTTEIAGEHVPLYPVDVKLRPNKMKLLIDILRAMRNSEQPLVWNNLPALLTGLQHCGGKGYSLSAGKLQQIIHVAATCGRLDVVLKCIRLANQTGLSLAIDRVRDTTVFELRQYMERENWTQEAAIATLRDAEGLATLLETESHGATTKLRADDPRAQRSVLALLLELAAVAEYRSADMSGRVTRYAERLLANVGDETPQISVDHKFVQFEVYEALMIYQGLGLATKLHGREWPQHNKALRVAQVYGKALNTAVNTLAASEPKAYAQAAIDAYKNVLVKV